MKPTVSKKQIVKSGFRVRVRTRHPSHQVLRSTLPRMPFRSVVRLGSTTEVADVQVECNSIQSVKNSSSKRLMKQCFTNAGVTTAPWFQTGSLRDWCRDKYPIIAKHIYGSRGTGNTKINNDEELQRYCQGKDTSQYIFEQYKSFLREYRLHVTAEGCFYACRKMLKRDTPEEKKFQRHDDNCVWIVEENPDFDRPVNWDAVVADCVRALASLGLDIGAFDLKIQGAKDKNGRVNPNPEWIVIESCSAPSFGTITTQKYTAEIPKVLLRKYQTGRR